MIQLTIIDAIAWGFIFTFWGAIFGILFIEKYAVKPLQEALKELQEMLLTHLDGEAKILRMFLNPDAISSYLEQESDGKIKSPIQIDKKK